MTRQKSSVKVTILGEEYTIRSEERPEHTRAVASYVDETIRGLMNAGIVVESQKAAILAAMQITSDLFHERESTDEVATRIEALSSSVKRLLPPAKRGREA